MKELPIARKADLIEQESDGDLLIYDLVTNKVLSLNQTSTLIYKACDGVTTFEELKQQAGLSEEIILLTLDILQKNNLLDSRENFLESFGDLSRRQIIRKMGLASMVALPVIAGLVAPRAAHGLSCAADGEPGSFTSVNNTNMIDCENVGYDDAACCSTLSRGVFDSATQSCNKILCSPRRQ